MATQTPEEFKQQFTPISPEQVYGNVKTNEPRKQLNSLDEIHPRANGHRFPLTLPGWDDHWSGKLQKFHFLSPDVLKQVFKHSDPVLVALDRLLPHGTPKVIGYTK